GDREGHGGLSEHSGGGASAAGTALYPGRAGVNRIKRRERAKLIALAGSGAEPASSFVLPDLWEAERASRPVQAPRIAPAKLTAQAAPPLSDPKPDHALAAAAPWRPLA